MTITGWGFAQSAADLQSMADQLTGLLAEGGEDRLTVTSPAGDVKYATVRLSGQPTAQITSPYRHTLDYQIQFWAVDPRKYGETRTFSGAASVVPWHRGNFAAVPEVTVRGSFSGGYRLIYGQSEFIVSAPLASGRTHRVDMRTGWLFENDVLKPGAVTRAELFTVPKGMQTQPLSVEPRSTGSGTVSVKLRDTYV